MIFAAGLFLTGLLAVGVPIAIHLLARQRTRVLAWGAMDFLRQSVSSATSRRKRLRDLLLLLLRVSAILCVVLAFAQPLVPFLLGKAQQQETIFIWDLSLSTSALNEQGVPLHETMKSRLLEELDRLPHRSSVRILLAGADTRWLKPNALTLSPANREALEQAIRRQPVQAGDSHLAQAILLALAMEDENETTVRFRELVVLHDFQRRAWQPDATEHWAVIHQQLTRDPNWSLRAIDPEVTAAREGPQVAVTHLAVNRDTVAPEAPVRLRATLRNVSRDLPAEGEVAWLVDGREVERMPAIDLAPDSELKLEQVVRFETTGCHRVECVFEVEGDILPMDNRAVCVVSTVEALPILVIDDTERTQPGQIRPSEFVVAALGGARPGKAATQKKPADRPLTGALSLFAPRVMRSTDLQADTLLGVQAVFLVAVDALPEEAMLSLLQFVQQGGGLWLVMNPRQEGTDPWCTALLQGFGLHSFAASEQRRAPERKPFLLKTSDVESTFAVNTVAQRLDLHRAEMQAVRVLDQAQVLPEEQLLETAEGIPVLLSLPVGAGRLFLQTTDLARENTNLPILQAFVPLVRELAWQTAGSSLPPRNLVPGEAIRGLDPVGGDALGAPVVILPDGRTQKMQRQGGSYRCFNTVLPGMYRLYDSQRGDADTATELFSVPRPAAESELDLLSPELLAAQLKPEGDTPAEAARPVKGKWPLAFWLALAAALFFLAEALLARSIAQKRAQVTSRIDMKPVF